MKKTSLSESEIRISLMDGFSLIEVTVAMGIAAVGMLAYTSMSEMNSKSARNFVQTSDAQSLANLIQMDFSNQLACTKTFQDLTFTVPPSLTFTLPVSQIKRADGTVIAATAPGVPNTFNSVNIPAGSMMLQNFQPNGTTSYLVSFSIAAAGVGASLGSQSFTRSFPLTLSVSVVGSTATVTGCGGGTTQAQSFTGGICRVPTGGKSCVSSLYWTTPFLDTNYTVTCSQIGPVSCLTSCGGNDSAYHIVSVTKFTDHVDVASGNGLANQSNDSEAAEIDCIAIHP
jgi:prepilin-type N-terminal cleavage/methylation domain-containing protein